MSGTNPTCQCGHPQGDHFRDGSVGGGGCTGTAIYLGTGPYAGGADLCRCQGFTEAAELTIPQSEHGGIHPELAAHITTAKAAMGDFSRQVDEYSEDPTNTIPAPPWQEWAFKLASHLAAIVRLLEQS